MQDIIITIFQQVIPVVLPLAIGYFVGVRKSDKALKRGVQALLLDRMDQAYEYYKRRSPKCPYATMTEKRRFSIMYICYHSLGENGVMTETYNEVLRLPTEPSND